MARPALTPRQREVLDFVEDFHARERFSPTRAEIARYFGFKSANAAEEHLQALARKGYVALKKGYQARGISTLGDPRSPWPFMVKAA